jgi:hypothetical protein
MTGRGVQILVKAFHLIVGELLSWLANRGRKEPKKE